MKDSYGLWRTGDSRNQHKTLSNPLTGSFNRSVTCSLGKIVEIGMHACMLTHTGSRRIKGQEPRICEIIIKKRKKIREGVVSIVWYILRIGVYTFTNIILYWYEIHTLSYKIMFDALVWCEHGNITVRDFKTEEPWIVYAIRKSNWKVCPKYISNQEKFSYLENYWSISHKYKFHDFPQHMSEISWDSNTILKRKAHSFIWIH